jgi:autotransporter-associated beta strand protein
VSGTLTKIGAGTLTLNAANTYTGNTVVNAGTLELGTTGQLKFVLGASSGVNNSITGSGTVSLKGSFVIDTSAADALSNGSWTLENVSTLPGAYEASFSVVGFTDAGSNKWTKANGTKIYTFDETTGILTLVAAGYSSWASINALTGTPVDDYDGDGVNNAVEYILGGTKDTNDLSKLPVLDASGANLVFTFKRDRTSIDGTTGVVIQVGTTLALWPSSYAVGTTTVGSTAGITVDENNPAGFDTVTLTVAKGTDPAKFARLVVTPAP